MPVAPSILKSRNDRNSKRGSTLILACLLHQLGDDQGVIRGGTVALERHPSQAELLLALNLKQRLLWRLWRQPVQTEDAA